MTPYDLERVLSKLNAKLQTLTPPPIQGQDQGEGQAPWAPETPYNIIQLELQAKAIKGYIKHRTTSPPTPTNTALNQLIKGCELVIHSAVLLTKENE